VRVSLESRAAVAEQASSPSSDSPFDSEEEPIRRFGDYELLEEIGRGGMGVVYRARQISLNREVAIKMIASGELASAEFVRRFLLEAEAAAGLKHPNIVAIHEVGVREGQHFYSMDYVEGQTLSDRAINKPLSPELACGYLKTIAEAVHYAHQRGILHRDLKPSNVLIDSLDQPHLTDFGLAKRLSDDSELTLTGQVLGSPNYMPPEQALGKRQSATIACDVYSLGAILYFLLTGRPPFTAESLTQTLQQVLHSEPVSPRLLNPSVPRDLETICLKCLSKEPDRRYRSAQELADELGRFLKGEPVQARPVGAAGKSWRWCRRNPVMASFAGATAFLLLAVTIGSPILVFRINRHRERAEREALHAKQAEHDATEKLWGLYYAQARASRRSGSAGRRFDSLDVLKKAAEIRPSPELRNEAIACMALTDLRISNTWRLELPANVDVHNVDVHFAPMLDRYAVVDYQQSVISVHRVTDRAELMTTSPPLSGARNQAKFSPNGQYFALVAASAGASNIQLTIFDLSSTNVVLRRAGDFGVEGMDFSPDSRFIAVVFRQGTAPLPPPVQTFELASGARIVALDQKIEATGAYFDPGGGRLAVFSRASTNVQIHDLRTTNPLPPLVHPSPLNNLAWCPDGELLATACADKRIYIWAAPWEKPRNVLSGPQSDIKSLAFNHAGDLIAASSWDTTIRIWDPLSAAPPLSAPGTSGFFSPNDSQLVCSRPWGPVIFAEVAAARECRVLHSDLEPYKGPRGCGFSPNSQWLASAHTDGVRIWEASSGKLLAFLRIGNTWSALFQPDGSLLTSGGGGLKHWPISLHAVGETHELELGPPRELSHSSCGRASLDRAGRILAFIDDQRVLVLDTVTSEVLRPLPAAEGLFIAVSPNAQWCAVGSFRSDRHVQICDLQNGQLISELQGSAGNAVSFSPDGSLLATCDMPECHFWSTTSWERVHTLPREAAGVQVPVAFSADSRMAAVPFSPTKVRLLALPGFRELATLESPDPQILSFLCFSPDGSRLAVAAETKQIRLWDLRSIRRQLAVMNLDWDEAPLPPRNTNRLSGPITVRVRGLAELSKPHEDGSR
jgi:WD40 repeat protein